MNFVESLLQESEGGERELARARLRVAVTEGLLLAMQAAGINKKDLAERIGISRSAVTQALANSRNLSLNTIADIADAIGLRVEVSFAPLAARNAQVSSGATVRTEAHAIQAACILFTTGFEHVHVNH